MKDNKQVILKPTTDELYTLIYAVLYYSRKEDLPKDEEVICIELLKEFHKICIKLGL